VPRGLVQRLIGRPEGLLAYAIAESLAQRTHHGPHASAVYRGIVPATRPERRLVEIEEHNSGCVTRIPAPAERRVQVRQSTPAVGKEQVPLPLAMGRLRCTLGDYQPVGRQMLAQ